MFNNTRSAINKVALDLKRIVFGLSLSTQLLLIVYFLYSIYFEKGNLVANIVLTVLSVAYLVFFILTRNMSTKEDKRLKSVTKKVYKYSKFVIKTLTLGGVIYGAAVAATDVGVFDIVVIALSLIGWLLQVVFEVVLSYIKQEIDGVIEGFKRDLEPITKPVSAVGDAIKKIKNISSSASQKREDATSGGGSSRGTASGVKLKTLLKTIASIRKKSKPRDIIIEPDAIESSPPELPSHLESDELATLNIDEK